MVAARSFDRFDLIELFFYDRINANRD